MTTVTVVIPSIPSRSGNLSRALKSIASQTRPTDAVVVALDNDRQGAGPTRTRALRMAKTEWVAFLDDDDYFLPNHLAVLLAAAEETGADVLWPWFEVVGGTDPFPGHRGRQLDPDNPHIFPITTLVRRSLTDGIEFPGPTGTADWAGDDWPFWRGLQSRGATFHHVNEVTWHWVHHGSNTSGRPIW